MDVLSVCIKEYEAIYLAKLTIKMMSPIQLGRSFSIQAGMPGMSTLFSVYNTALILRILIRIGISIEFLYVFVHQNAQDKLILILNLCVINENHM